jgi:hypothetical protein
MSAIDPAVLRRATDIFRFDRPSNVQRRAVLSGPLEEVGFSKAEVDALVEATGGKAKKSPGFTFSDLTQRLLPTIVLDAYPDRQITFERALQLAKSTAPTPPFRDGAQS